METQEFKINIDLKNDHVEVNGVKYFPHLKAGKSLFGIIGRKTCRDCVFYEMTIKKSQHQLMSNDTVQQKRTGRWTKCVLQITVLEFFSPSFSALCEKQYFFYSKFGFMNIIFVFLQCSTLNIGLIADSFHTATMAGFVSVSNKIF